MLKGAKCNAAKASLVIEPKIYYGENVMCTNSFTLQVAWNPPPSVVTCIIVKLKWLAYPERSNEIAQECEIIWVK